MDESVEIMKLLVDHLVSSSPRQGLHSCGSYKAGIVSA